MANFVDFPPQLEGLRGKVQWLQQVNENEFTASCPQCGVQPNHSDANPSNRFVIWISSRKNGKPFGLCVRHCGYKWSADKADAIWTPEEKAEFEIKRKEWEAAEALRIREYAINTVMKQGIYTRYHESVWDSPLAKEELSKRGLWHDFYVRTWLFGFIPDYKVTGLGTYYSPALTIPVFGEACEGYGGIIENVKVRVLNPKCSDDRYRNLYKTKAQHLHFPAYMNKRTKKAFVVEGELKADTVAIRTPLIENDFTVIGTQGKGVGAYARHLLDSFEEIYLALDPDAFFPDKNGTVAAINLARQLNVERVRFVALSEKVDDAIMKGFNLLNAANMAINPKKHQYWA